MIIEVDRKKGPEFQILDKIDFLPISRFVLSNGVDVSLLEAGSQDVTKIDWLFPAGAVQAGKPLLASTVGNLMLEGTDSRTSAEISDIIDFYGAHLNVQTYHHNSVITLICLTKELPQLLPVVEDIVRNAVFDAKEYYIYLNKRRQEYLLESEKVRTIAARKFGQVVFGEAHPYGRQLELSQFDTLTREETIAFYKNAYTPLACRIVVAGQPGSDIKDLLTRHFGGVSWREGMVNLNGVSELMPSPDKFHLVEKDGALQSAIRLGRPLFNNNHPDFIPLQVVNTILGGYFGSRLMTAVREEKGLTYGIGSSIVSYQKSGMWVIASEVMGEMREAAVEAIFEEVKRMTDEPVDKDELELVRNYMLGELLRHFDGPFSSSDIYRSLWEFGLDFGFYAKMVEVIKTIGSEEIQLLSAKYLKREDFYVVVAGR
ncbi:MAG: insulinase family protein [Bacteroidales bacterium]|nr:insulinase family protein [Bacteroidales bacterium]